ncbi:MAG: c-type cytochrome domain-containing protein, partial [Pirellulales bacterium]
MPKTLKRSSGRDLAYLFAVFSFSLVVAILFVTDLAADEANDPVEGGDENQVAKISYSQQILPILRAECWGCHQPAKASGSYVMSAFDSLLAGGDSETPSIVPGKPDESYLLELITPIDGSAEMPKDKKPLADTQISLIRQWILEGAENDSAVLGRVEYSAENPPQYFAPPVIPSIDFSPDGKLLAVAGFHEVLLHQADGSGLVARLVGMSERIESVRFSPDGTRLAVAGGQPARMGEVQIWDVAKRELTLSYPIGHDTVYGANWSPDGKLVSIGCPDNTLRVIEADGGKQVLFQGSHSDWVFDTVFSLKGDHVISVGRDRTVKLTELTTQRFVDNITTITPGISKGGVGSVDRHPTGDAVVVGGADGVPKIYRVFRESKRVIGDDANLIKKLPTMDGPVFAVAFSPDGTRVAAGGSLNGHGNLSIYAVEFEVKLIEELKKISEKVARTRSAEENQILEKARTENIRLLANVTLGQGGVYCVSFSPDGKTLAAAGADGTVRLYHADTGAILKEFNPITISASQQVAQSEKQSPTTVSAEKLSSVAQSELSLVDGAEAGKIGGQLPENTTIVGIDVQPTTITLDYRFDTVQLIVTAQLDSGATIDITRTARRELSADTVAITSGGLVRPKLNGQARLIFTAGQYSTMVPINISGIRSDAHVDFIRDVTPVISKLGCNAGTCHGSKKGKNGFKLSLRGYDPLVDVRALTEDLASRRVSVASPKDSLALLKATGVVPHVGGQVTRPGEPYYEILRRWISAGATLDTDVAKVTSIEVFPKNPVVQRIGDQQQMRVVATYSDGSQRDVSAETFLASGDMDIVEVNGSGLVTTLRRGESAVLARYQGSYAATTVTVMGDRTGFVWQDPA